MNYEPRVIDLFKGALYDFAWCFVLITLAELLERLFLFIRINPKNQVKLLVSYTALILMFFLDQYSLTTGVLLNNMVMKFTFDQLIGLLAFQENISVIRTIWVLVIFLLYILVLNNDFLFYRINQWVFAVFIGFTLISITYTYKVDRENPNLYAINKSDYLTISLIDYAFNEEEYKKVYVDYFKNLDPLFVCKNQIEPYTLLTKKWLPTSEFSTFFNKTSNGKAPNVCIIIVESLSANLVGEYADKTGHLMPFLDSLSKHSLFFPNALSTAQRTHHVLPAVLGSLPHSRNHTTFQEVEYPQFESIFTQLKTTHYSSFYCGIDLAFNQMHRFIDNCQVDYASASFSGFSSDERAQIDKDYWGAPDGWMFREFLKESQNRRNKGVYNQKSALDVILTISTHEPFAYPDKKTHSAFAKSQFAKVKDLKTKKYLMSKSDELGVFHYADQQLQKLIATLSKRKEYQNTIFVLTGDHGSSLLYDNQMSKYRVPMFVFSPLLKKPSVIPYVVSHLDIAPTLLNYLRTTYRVQLKPTNEFLGEEFSLRSQKPRLLAFKDEYLVTSSLYYNGKALVNNQLYTLDKQLTPTNYNNPDQLQQLKDQLNYITNFNFYTIEQNHVLPITKNSDIELKGDVKLSELPKNAEYVKVFEIDLEQLKAKKMAKDHLIVDVFFELNPQLKIDIETFAVWTKMGDGTHPDDYSKMQWLQRVNLGKEQINQAEVHFYLNQEDLKEPKKNQKIACFVHNPKKLNLPFTKLQWRVK